MSDKIPQFLKRVNDSLLFNLDNKEFIFYIPEVYFERKNAIIVGEYVNVLGLMDYTIQDIKTGKNNGLKNFNFPTVFLTKPSSIEKIRGVRLTSTSYEEDFRLLKYKKGDQIVVSTKVPEDFSNVEEFFRLFNTGKLPHTIRYDKAHELFNESLRLNGSSFKINRQLFGILVSEMFRSDKDLTVPFRLSGESNMTKYKTVNIKDIPKYNGAFTAITSENWDEAVITASISKNSKSTPLEKLLMD